MTHDVTHLPYRQPSFMPTPPAKAAPVRPRHTAAIHLRLPPSEKRLVERMSCDLGISAAAVVRLALHQLQAHSVIALRH